MVPPEVCAVQGARGSCTKCSFRVGDSAAATGGTATEGEQQQGCASKQLACTVAGVGGHQRSRAGRQIRGGRPSERASEVERD